MYVCMYVCSFVPIRAKRMLDIYAMKVTSVRLDMIHCPTFGVSKMLENGLLLTTVSALRKLSAVLITTHVLSLIRCVICIVLFNHWIIFWSFTVKAHESTEVVSVISC